MATREYTTYDGISRAARRQELRRRRRVRLSVLVAAVLLPAVFVIQALLTRGEVMPGTTVAGVDVGGLVEDHGARPDRPRPRRPAVGARHRAACGGTAASVVPAELGIKLDADATVARAYGTGRVSARLLPFVWSGSAQPVLTYPTKLKLPKVLDDLEQKPRNARPVVQDDGTVGVIPAEDGLRYDDATDAARDRGRRAAAVTAASR